MKLFDELLIALYKLLTPTKRRAGRAPKGRIPLRQSDKTEGAGCIT